MTGPQAREGFPVGAAVTRAELERDPHPALARLRESEPVSWLPALGGWLVTRRELALRVLRDPGTFTVDDPRFSTARVVGPSMLSLDGAEHGRHRDPFSGVFRLAEVEARLSGFVRAEAARLVAGIRPAGRAELRRTVAGPLAVAVVARVLGLGETDAATVLAWYDAIVSATSALAGDPDGLPGPAAREAFGALDTRVRAAITRPDGAEPPSLLGLAAAGGSLRTGEVVSNAAVLMFGGIETTEGMICNAVWCLLSDPAQLEAVRAGSGLIGNAVEESLRLEPAAAVVDRYATADVSLGGAGIRRGDLVTVSLAGANRDPAFFPEPDRFDIRRANARQNLAFAHGPHFCLGAHLARLEAREVLRELLDQLPALRLDRERSAAPRGLVFRKPPELGVVWRT